MRLRIPNKGEMGTLLKWGSIRLILAGGELLIFTWKGLSYLSFRSADVIERKYREFITRPFDALIWTEPKAIEAEIIPLMEGDIELFDWNQFRANPDMFPHIRIIAKSGMGKTTLARYLMHLLGGKQCAITPKAKPNDWNGIEVYGKGFKYGIIEAALIQVKDLMYANYELIDQSLTPEMANIALDEFRLIKENVECAGELVKEFITVARDARIRLLALAQGEQVKTWGLEGESDLGECFTDVRLGEFAIDHAKRIKAPREVQEWLAKQKRPCMVDRYPAEIPNLQSFQFNSAQSPIKLEFGSSETPETILLEGSESFQNSQNEVLDPKDLLLFKAFQAANCSESEFIKKVFGASKYQEGKEILTGLKQRVGS